jgi:predicted nucleic acid-binding protein
VIRRYVFDTGALIAAERGKERVSRFFRLAQVGAARIVVPLPVIAEWWRGRTDAREEILRATQVIATIEIAKAAGVALSKEKRIDGKLTIDATVMATAAMLDAILVTQDPDDFSHLGAHFPRVVILSV